MSIIRWVDKLWYIKTKEHHLEIKGVNYDMLDKMDESKKKIIIDGKKSKHKKIYTIWFHLNEIL